MATGKSSKPPDEQRRVESAIKKCHFLGLPEALSDRAKMGRPPVISQADKDWVKSLADLKAQEFGYAQKARSVKKLAKRVHRARAQAGHPSLADVSHSRVWSILNGEELKPRTRRREGREP